MNAGQDFISAHSNQRAHLRHGNSEAELRQCFNPGSSMRFIAGNQRAVDIKENCP
jgi:hypothetical protein